jgi:uncharacterized protein with beta-barrel porin domain
MRNILLLLTITLASCGSSRHVLNSNTTKDSTTTQTTTTRQEDFNAVKQGQTVVIRDSIRTEVVFKTDTLREVEIRFEQGKIQYVKGPVERITTTDTHAADQRDSLQTLTYIQSDSIATLQTRLVAADSRKETTRKGWPWYIWFILGGLTGPFLWELIKKLYKKATI